MCSKFKTILDHGEVATKFLLNHVRKNIGHFQLNRARKYANFDITIAWRK